MPHSCLCRLTATLETVVEIKPINEKCNFCCQIILCQKKRPASSRRRAKKSLLTCFKRLKIKNI